MEVFSSFATIIGLICNYKSEKRATAEDEYGGFIEWLEEKRHKDLISELHSNHMLGLSIKNLLNQNNELVLEKLALLDKSILDIASMIGGLKDIAIAFSPEERLSDQAISILKQFEESGGSTFLELKHMQGTDYHVMDGDRNKSVIQLSEERFVNDDLDKLCSLGLLNPDYNSKGSRLFRITRAAVSLVKSLDNCAIAS